MFCAVLTVMSMVIIINYNEISFSCQGVLSIGVPIAQKVDHHARSGKVMGSNVSTDGIYYI